MEKFYKIKSNKFLDVFCWIKTFFKEIKTKEILFFSIFLFIFSFLNFFLVGNLNKSLSSGEATSSLQGLDSIFLTVLSYVAYFIQTFSVFYFIKMKHSKEIIKSFSIFFNYKFYLILLSMSFFVLISVYLGLNIIFNLIPESIMTAVQTHIQDNTMTDKIFIDMINNFPEVNLFYIIISTIITFSLVSFFMVSSLYAFYLYVVNNIENSIIQSYKDSFLAVLKNVLPLFFIGFLFVLSAILADKLILSFNTITFFSLLNSIIKTFFFSLLFYSLISTFDESLKIDNDEKRKNRLKKKIDKD